ncbi:ATP phosphoribosyltransferase [Cyclobacteriaceae bacterium]|nr:ATP phosphoribosyltransferase [Cyclobacteriaceae bacterium]
MGEILRIAVQKKGRLSEDSLKLIKECGINFSKNGGTLKSNAYNFPIEFLYLRDDDIPGYVEDGVADIGIIGENVLVEYKKNVEIVLRLGFSKCRLSIGVPKDAEYNSIKDMEGKEIATSYPNLLGSYLEENGVKAHIHIITGSVEIAPSIGLADAVCDIVSSGSTLISNGLKEAEGIFKSEAVLIGNQDLSAEKQAILDKLLFRMKAVMPAKNTKYISLNAPNNAVDAICDLLPGVNSPSINPLRKEGWSSISSVVNENDFWKIVDQVRELGAEGLLVLPIEKIIE